MLTMMLLQMLYSDYPRVSPRKLRLSLIFGMAGDPVVMLGECTGGDMAGGEKAGGLPPNIAGEEYRMPDGGEKADGLAAPVNPCALLAGGLAAAPRPAGGTSLGLNSCRKRQANRDMKHKKPT